MTDTDVRRLEDKVDLAIVTLARLEGSLSPTLKSLTDQQADTDKTIEDIEKRLRGLERFRYSVPSLSVVAILLTAVEALYYLTHLH